MGTELQTAPKPKTPEAAPIADPATMTENEAVLILATATTKAEVDFVTAKFPDLVAKYLANKKALGTTNDFAALMAGYRGEMEDKPFDSVGAVKHKDELKTSTTTDAKDPTAPVPSEKLPFNESGWDALAITTRLGQRDRLLGTDSDGERCAQAAALAAHVLRGPAACVAWIRAQGTEAYEAQKQPEPRRIAAADTLSAVCQAIEGKSATYGDLSWAQEALHDISYSDTQGTETSAIMNAEKTDSWTAIGKMCTTAAEVMTHAESLVEGEQLMLVAWTYAFNDAFTAAGSTKDEMTTPEGQLHREAIPKKGKPAAADFQEARDERSAHQLMIARFNGKLYLYDSEVTAKGVHMREIGGKEVSLLADYLDDDMKSQQKYEYVEVAGKLAQKGKKK